MLVIIIPVRWFRVPNAGLTRSRLENWVYGPARLVPKTAQTNGPSLGRWFGLFLDGQMLVRTASGWSLGVYGMAHYHNYICSYNISQLLVRRALHLPHRLLRPYTITSLA